MKNPGWHITLDAGSISALTKEKRALFDILARVESEIRHPARSIFQIVQSAQSFSKHQDGDLLSKGWHTLWQLSLIKTNPSVYYFDERGLAV